MKLKFIFEDEDIIVVDKPAGLTVNRSETTKGDTLQDYLDENFKINVERSGIVHRLDKETSGILIVAKNTESFINLQKQFKERKVKKTYIALVHGIVNADGEVRVPIGRLPWNRKRFGVLAGGRDAVTKFKILKNNIKIKQSLRSKDLNNEPLSLLELYPETGRTHQIRVHMKYLNHPVFADELYAGRKTARSDREVLPRLFLHASFISFTHPKTGDMLEFKSDIPEELLKIIN